MFSTKRYIYYVCWSVTISDITVSGGTVCGAFSNRFVSSLFFHTYIAVVAALANNFKSSFGFRYFTSNKSVILQHCKSQINKFLFVVFLFRCYPGGGYLEMFNTRDNFFQYFSRVAAGKARYFIIILLTTITAVKLFFPRV